MPERERTAKNLGQRHDLHYFQKWTRWRLARAVLMAVGPALAGSWLLVCALERNRTPYVSGPLSTSHSFLGKRCESCHVAVLKAGAVRVGFRRHVRDEACLSCHRAPAHHADLATSKATCASCHTEHTGSQHLRQAADENCVECHADLRVTNGSPHFQTAIYNFRSRHPEFGPIREQFSDPGTIKLNHAIHMRPGLTGPNSEAVQMQCRDCHRTPAEQSEAWRYGYPRFVNSSVTSFDEHNPPMPADPIRPASGRAYMAAPTYQSTCQRCHLLQFDSHFDESVPHDKPQVVREFIIRKLTDYVRQHPEAVHEIPRPMRIVFGGTVSREPKNARVARSAEEWVRLRTEDAENLLWRKTCVQCHALKYGEAGQSALGTLAEIAPANIKAVWLPKSVFSHYAHASFDCKSCHVKVLSSEHTSDVLIPSISICQHCHNGDPAKLGHAQDGCFLCHQYHDWKDQNSPFLRANSAHQSGRSPNLSTSSGF